MEPICWHYREDLNRDGKTFLFGNLGDPTIAKTLASEEHFPLVVQRAICELTTAVGASPSVVPRWPFGDPSTRLLGDKYAVWLIGGNGKEGDGRLLEVMVLVLEGCA